MARGRRGSASPVSFFAFQDVMIGTIGVVLVVTLLLLLQIGQVAVARIDPERREPIVAPVVVDPVIEDDSAERASLTLLTQDILEANDTLRTLRRQIDQARATVEVATLSALRDTDAEVAAVLLADQDRLRRDIEAMRNRRLVYLIADRQSRPVVAELGAGRCVVSTDQAHDPPIAIRQDDPAVIAQQLLEWYQSQANLSNRHLLIVLKPSGRPIWEALQQSIQTDPQFQDLSIGLDLIPEHASTTRFPGT